jgi:phage I-like protein
MPSKHIPSADSLDVAVLSFELAVLSAAAGESVTAPKRVQLTPAGFFKATDARADWKPWNMTEALANQLIASLAAKKVDIVVDYEHQTLRKEANGQPAPAAGWFKSVSFESGKGLFAEDVEWTPLAAQRITSKEYRYISPVILFNPATGDVRGLHSVALTNTPALDSLDPLTKRAALNSFFSTADSPTGGTMDKDQQIAALTAQNDASKTATAALTTERDALKTNVAALTQERDSLIADKAKAAAAADKAEHARVLAAALSGDTPLLTPAQKPWAEKQSLAALNEYLAATKPVMDTKRQSGGAGEGSGGTGVAALSQIEMDMCARTGTSHADFIKAKAA